MSSRKQQTQGRIQYGGQDIVTCGSPHSWQGLRRRADHIREGQQRTSPQEQCNGKLGSASLTQLHTGWWPGCCLPPARPWNIREGKDRARSKGTWARQVGQVLAPEEPYFQNRVETGNWGSDMGPVIKVGHESRVREGAKPAIQNPEFQNRTRPSHLPEV